ncbi:MAG: ABC transporter permease [Chloroflexota bacterium]
MIAEAGSGSGGAAQRGVQHRSLVVRPHRRLPPALLPSGILLLLLVVVAAAAPILPLPSPFAQTLADAFARPLNAGYLLGADNLGRSELSRLVYGLRPTLFISLVGGLVATILGTVLGLASGYGTPWSRRLANAGLDVLLTFPSFVLAIALVSVAGRNVPSLIAAVGVTGAGNVGRLVRGETLRVAAAEFVTAMVVSGSRLGRVLFRGVLPSLIGIVLVQFSIVVSVAILTISALGFIGLGIAPPQPELGAMVSDGARYLLSDFWLVALPGLLISALILALNLLGDALRDLFDPRLARYLN